MRNLTLAAGIIALLVACASPGQRSPEERALIACTAWSEVFKTINTRRQFGLASTQEIQAINTARPILVPACLAENLGSTTAPQLDVIELVLLEVLSTEGKN